MGGRLLHTQLLMLVLISVGASAVLLKGCKVSRERDLWGDLFHFFVSLVRGKGFFFFEVLASGAAAGAPADTRVG